MTVNTIQPDAVSTGARLMARTIPACALPLSRSRETGHKDGYVRIDASFAKFRVRPLPWFAQVAAPKAPSYRDVSDRLKAIDRVRPGPMAQALRRRLVDKLVKQGAAVLPHLIKALAHGDKVVRLRAIDVLARIFRGTASSPNWKGVVCRLIVTPKLTAMLKDGDAGVRGAVQKALHSIKSQLPPTDNSNPLDGDFGPSGSQP